MIKNRRSNLWILFYSHKQILNPTSKTLRVRDNAGVLVFLKVKKMLRRALPSSSSNTICSLASAASAAAAAASLSLRASSIKL